MEFMEENAQPKEDMETGRFSKKHFSMTSMTWE